MKPVPDPEIAKKLPAQKVDSRRFCWNEMSYVDGNERKIELKINSLSYTTTISCFELLCKFFFIVVAPFFRQIASQLKQKQ